MPLSLGRELDEVNTKVKVENYLVAAFLLVALLVVVIACAGSSGWLVDDSEDVEA